MKKKRLSANKKELINIGMLTVILAFMDISGLPSLLFMNVSISDINPYYWTLMLNFIIIGLFAFIMLKFVCPNWKLGFKKEGLKEGLKKYGIPGIIAGIMSLIAFCIGLEFNYTPSVWKVIIEGIIYYIGVAIIEELYVRGLLLNLIEKIFHKRKNSTVIAIIISAFIFGLGHAFEIIVNPVSIVIAKVVWTTCMGLYFGTIYKKTGNLWLPIILHYFINLCALPYCFTAELVYPNISLYIIIPTYILLGCYSIYIMVKKK